MFNNKLDERFRDVVAIIEATSTEQFFLWKEFNKIVPWEHDQRGYSININTSYLISLTKRPINLCFAFIKIAGKRIVFWEPISELVDYFVIDEWIKENLPNVCNENAINFHNALAEIYPQGLPLPRVSRSDILDLIVKAN